MDIRKEESASPPFKAVVFDLDGVIVKTPHYEAWKRSFETHTRREFTPGDYARKVSGRPREEGVRSYLAAVGIPSTEDLVGKIARDKQQDVVALMEQNGVEAYADTINLMKALKARGVKIAVASSSANTPLVLDNSHVTDAEGERTQVDFWGMVDVVIAKNRVIKRSEDKDVVDPTIKGKPEPDIFTRACEELGVEPNQALGFEDAPSGIEAFRRGGIPSIGVNRENVGDELNSAGAEAVFEDMSEVTVDQLGAIFTNASKQA